MSTPPETYLTDETYFGLIDDLLNVSDAFDPRSRVIELLGEIANVWPNSIRTDTKGANAYGENAARL